jgi:hypothetical protein
MDPKSIPTHTEAALLDRPMDVLLNAGVCGVGMKPPIFYQDAKCIS